MTNEDPDPAEAFLGAEAERTFRAGVVTRDGAVAGFWHTLTAAREIGPPARRGHPARARPGHVTWCKGVVLRVTDGLAVARTFEFRVGMGDEEIESRAMAGAMRPGVRTQTLPFPRCVSVLLEGVEERRPGEDRRMAVPGGACLRHLEEVDGSDALEGTRRALALRAAERVREVAAPFLASLDPGAVELVMRREQALLDGPWWGVAPSMGRGAPLAAALDGHPHLRVEVLEAWEGDPEAFADAVRDGGLEPVARAVMSGEVRRDGFWTSLGIAEAAAGGGPGPWLGQHVSVPDAPGSLAGAFRIVTRVAEAHAPRDVAGWEAALHLSPTLAVAREMAGRHAKGFVGVEGDWIDLLARLRRAAGEVPVSTAAFDLRDVTAAFHRQLYAPAVMLHAARSGEEPSVMAGVADVGSLLYRAAG